MKRSLVTLLIAVITLSCMFVGCGGAGDKIGNSEQDLEIVLWQSGYGRDYLDTIIEAYKTKHPEVNISLTASAGKDNEPIYSNPDTNTVDLYFTSFPEYGSVVNYNGRQILEDLNGVLDMKADGETKTLREKFGSNILNAVTNSEGKIYSLPWYHSLCGLIYNVDMFRENGWDCPRTTEELVSLAEVINSSGKTPFIHYADYWKYMYEAWVAQYESISNYQDIWKGIYTDPAGEKHANDVRFITESQGRYESYKVLSELLGPKGNVYKSSNSLDHTRSQTYFLDGRAVMMPGGSWVENEMKEHASQFN
ncbi:MAG: extracellular solute-binding protein [Clostridia bacterium]|nr:extracellular solute-binding protein [Clostridia bacterium]